MSKKSEKNQQMVKQLADIFYPNGQIGKVTCIDFMGYEINDQNRPTYHHIEKAASLREKNLNDDATINNGAILSEGSHELLNFIEKESPELYIAWNNLFLKINQSKKEYWDEFIPEIIELQERTEEVINAYNERKNLKGQR